MEQEVLSSETTTRSVKRATDLLRRLAETANGCNLTELARGVNLSKATAYRIIQTLVAEGFADYDETAGLYTIGTELVRITMAARKSSRLTAIETFGRLSAPLMQSLCAETGETVALVVRQGDQRTNIAVELGSHELIAVPKVGARHPLHLGGPGQLILAFLPQAGLEAFARRADSAPVSSRSFVYSEQIEARLRQIRTDGYATSLSEAVEGQASIAAPVTRNGKVIAALNLIVPAVRFNDRKRADFIPRVKITAAGLSRLVEAAWTEDAFDGE